MDDNMEEDEVVDKYVFLIFKDKILKSLLLFLIKVRDEYRKDYDPGRGGFGKRVNPAMEMEKGGGGGVV